MEENNNQECDFSPSEINSFFYTNEKQIRRMDDKFILSKITEKYQDFKQSSSESLIKQVILVIASDTKLIEDIEKKYDINPLELFKIIYRNYEYVFNKCFISKIQKTIKNKKYVKRAACRRPRSKN